MVYFVRHGNKVISDSDEYYNSELGIMDEPLSEAGRTDAERLAAYFKDIDIKRIIVSEYKRAYETALPTSKQKNIPITVDKRVNEINNGEIRNMADDEIAAKYPQLWSDFQSHERDFRFPGGESGEEVKARQDSFLNDIKHEKGDILVVSHDGFIRLLMCNILGLPVYKRYIFKTTMGAVSIISYDDSKGEWKTIRFNQPV